MRRLVIGCALFAGLACIVSAETVYRCGPGGNSYSQTPCPDGQAVDMSDRRTPDDVHHARRVARTERTLGDSLEQERLQRENAPPLAGSLSPLPREPKADGKTSKKKEKKKPKDFTLKLAKPKKKSGSS